MPRRILLADDSVTAQNMGRKILTDAGYEVITVNNGSAALKKIGESKPDLIVLDVYMPGYSGLEVCFRVKEARDTSSIPVLLTVGKLEPFKQDEARRARADAFIIKPFEASELLAALNKLESNLTSGGKTHPAGEGQSRSAKDMASFERHANERGPRYGDEESGWKARLKIPSGQQASDAGEPEPMQIAPGGGLRDRLATDATQPTSSAAARPAMERPIPAGIPQDITPEEIAALSAAAARVGMGFNGKQFEPLTTPNASSPQQVMDEKESKAEPEAQSPEAAEDSKTTGAPALGEAPTAQELSTTPPQVVASASSITEESTAACAPAREEVDTVVSSVVASTIGTGGVDVSSGSKASAPGSEEKAPEPVAVAATASSESATMAVGARWMAEEIPVEAGEMALVLEKEMHKAFAAFAAAEYGPRPYESAPVDREDEPMFATMAPPAIGSPVPVAEAASSESDSKEPPGTASMVASAAAAASATTEAPHTLETVKPPVPFTPPATTLDEEKHAVAAFGGPQQFGVSGPAPAPVVQGATPSESKAGETVKTVEESKATATPVASEKGREAEMAVATAAAWAKWRDIRESVVGDKPGGATAEVASAAPAASVVPTSAAGSKGGFEDFTAVRGSGDASEPGSDEAVSAGDDAEAVSADSLSTIVDGMLAELKPKLMAELAKKLEKEKGKKK